MREGKQFVQESSGPPKLAMAQAVARAEMMRAKRIVRMEKQLAEIRALTFEEVSHEA